MICSSKCSWLGKVHATFLTFFLEYGAVGHLPFDIASENPLPFCAEAPLGGMARGLPSPYLFKQGPVGQRQVLIHLLAGIVGKQELHGVAENVTEVDVDGARRPVIVDVGIEIHAGIEEHLQGRKARFMYRKSLVRDDRVVNESGEIDRADRHAAHIGVAQNIVEVVRGIAAGDNRLEHVEPSRNAGVVFAFFLENHMRDLVGVEFLAFGEWAGRAAPDLADDRTQMVANDNLSKFFVTGTEGMQVVVVEEMTERAMADVVHECRDAEKFFDIVRRGTSLTGFFRNG